MNERPGWRISLQAWSSLLALGLALWLIIKHGTLILEMCAVLFGALLLSLAIRPAAEFMARRRIPRELTVLGVYVALIGVLALLVSLLAPVVKEEATLFRKAGPDLIQTALSRITAIPGLGEQLPSADAIASDVTQRLGAAAVMLVAAASSVGRLIIDLLVILVLGYFLSCDATVGTRILQSWVPARHQPRLRAALVALGLRLTRWIWAQLAIACYFAVTFSIGLALLRVPFALTIGLVGGALEIIPYLGGATALTLAGIAALTISPWHALWVLLFYLVVVEVESHIIAPAFYGRILGLHPALVLIALLTGVKLAGVIGVLFALPLTVVLMALVQELRMSDVEMPAVETTGRPDLSSQPKDNQTG